MEKRKSRSISVNNNLLGGIAVLLIILNAILFLWSSTDVFSGKVTETANTKICIGVIPTIKDFASGLPQVLNGTINITVTANSTVSVDFYRTRYGSFRKFMGTDYNDGD